MASSNAPPPTKPQWTTDSFLDDLLGQRSAGEPTDYATPDGIVRFVRDVLHADPAPYQEDILRDLVRYKREAVRGPHGLGKTALAAWVIWWGVTCLGDDVKVVTTASAWRQLIYFTWTEVHKWALRADWTALGLTITRGQALLERSIKLPGRDAFPVASDNPALIEGAHARRIIYVFDEAKTIPAATWDAIEGAFSSAGSDTDADAYALAISTPGDTSGRFYDIHKRRPGYEDWHTRHVTLEEAVAAGRISREWADQRRVQWGETSPVYLNRVLGEFAEGGTDTLIPLAWIEAANERWLAREGKGDGALSYGVDVARFGDDSTVTARRVGSTLETLDYAAQQDTMETTGRVILAVKHDTATPIFVDVIGIGAGVVDRLREQGYAVTGVNVSEAAKDAYGQPLTDASGELGFVNLRSWLWWMLRERLDPRQPDPMALPPDDRLTGDLTAPRWKVTSGGRIQVESKDDIRKRIGRSTDSADAVALAFAAQSAVFFARTSRSAVW